MAIFMKVEDVKGDVEAAGFTEAFLLYSVEWGIRRAVGSPKSSAKDRESGAASVSEITVTKENDDTSTGLLRLAMWGKAKKAQIHFLRTGDNQKMEEYLTYELENVLLSDYSTASAGDRPTEKLSLNFTTIAITSVDCIANHETGTPDRCKYDLATGKGS